MTKQEKLAAEIERTLRETPHRYIKGREEPKHGRCAICGCGRTDPKAAH